MPLLPLSLAVGLALATPADDAGDTVLTALAADRPRTAARLLQAALAKEDDADARANLICLLGDARERVGDIAGAVASWSEVPEGAPCYAGAQFDRADALARLGRDAEAAELYERLGHPATTAGRDHRTAARVRALLAATEAATGDSLHPRLGRLHALALELNLLAPDRLDAAQAALAWLDQHPQLPADGLATTVAATFIDLLERGEIPPEATAETRRSAARLVGGADGLALLAPVADGSPEHLAAHAEVVWSIQRAAGLLALERAVAAQPDDAELRLLLAHRATDEGWHGLATPHWEALVDGVHGDVALLALASDLVERGADPIASLVIRIEHTVAWLDRFPSHPLRSTVARDLEHRTAQLARQYAIQDQPEAGLAALQGLFRTHRWAIEDPWLEWEVAELAWRAGRVEEARAWWENMLSRDVLAADVVASLAELRATADPDSVQGWLEAWSRRDDPHAHLARLELARRTRPSLVLSAGSESESESDTPVPLPDADVVRAHVRNIGQLDVRIHRIDAEAFFRAGGNTAALGTLDVGVIGPDETHTVPMPDTPVGVEQTLPLPIVPQRPGYYAVTASGEAREATVVVRRGTSRVLAQAFGGELVVGMLSDGRTEAGARVLVANGEKILEGRTDADGLARFPLEAGGETRILGIGRSGPALARLQASAARPQPGTTWRMETDRPFVVAGEPASVRLSGRTAAGPVTGTIRLRMRVGGVPGPTTTAELSPLGTASAQLSVPPGVSHAQATVEVLQADADDPSTVGTLPRVQPARAGQNRARAVRTAGGGLQLLTVDAAGARVGDQSVEIRSPTGDRSWHRTDSDGILALPPTVYGDQGTWTFRLPGGLEHTLAPASVPRLSATSRVSPDGRITVRIKGPPGPVAVLSSSLLPSPTPVAPLPGPRQVDTYSVTGPRASTSAQEQHARTRSSGADQPGRAAHTIPDSGVLEVMLDGTSGIASRVHIVSRDGLGGSVTLDIGEQDGPVLDQPLRWTPDSTLGLRVEEPTLLTVASADGLVARWIRRTSDRLPVDATHTARATWIDARGRMGLQEREVATDLRVDLEAEPAGDRWRVRVGVTDAAGVPVRAEVVLRALDRDVAADLAALGIPAGWPTRRGRTPNLAATAMAWGGPLRHRTLGTRIEQALQAEAQRSTERERARRAAAGALEGGASGILMNHLVLEEAQHGGLGTSGYGSGGGGYGSGSGRVGRVGGRASSGRPPTLGPGTLSSGLWEVVETDRSGLAVVVVDAPPAGHWLVQAHARTAASEGSTDVVLDTDQAPRLVLPRPGSAVDGELLMAAARVVNPSDQPALVQIDGASVTILPKGDQRLTARPLTAGQATTFTVQTPDGEVLDQRELYVPVARPASGADDGTLVRVSVDPGDQPPAWQWLREDRTDSTAGAGHIARTGRLAVTLATDRRGAEAGQARTVAFEQLQRLRLAGPAQSVPDAASVVAFLAEVAPMTRGERATERPMPPVTTAELDNALTNLHGRVQSSADRATEQWAMVVAGRTPDETTLARLVRDVDRLPSHARARLADLERRRGSLGTALELDPSDDALSAVVAFAAGADTAAPRLPALPPPGHIDRYHAILNYLSSSTKPSSSKEATVLVDGQAVATLDAGRGGVVELLVSSGASVTVEGARNAVIERGTAHREAKTARSVLIPGAAGTGPVQSRARVPDVPTCGTASEPCQLRVGDALRIPSLELPPGTHCGAGLRCSPGRIQASEPGRFTVTGIRSRSALGSQEASTLHVEVTLEDALPLTRDPALDLARAMAAAGRDPTAVLAPWPHFDDWADHQRAEVMDLRWRFQANAEPADLVARFEDLRDARPDAPLTLEEVGAVAVAYRAAGDPARALQVWRAGLGAAFLAEAAPLRRLESVTSGLSSLQALVELPQAYPDLPVVREAEFHLPGQLASMADRPLPPELLEQGVTPTDIRLLAAAWHRRFLALHPDSPLAAEAGFHLAKGLLGLGAAEAAAEQARDTAERFPDTPLLDALAATEARARTHLGDATAARAIYGHIAEGTDWPREDGTRSTALLREDARLALARLDEATGRFSDAREGYLEVAAHTPEAAHAAEALGRVVLEAEETVLLQPLEPASVDLVASNAKQVYLRAYRVDLRTAFLRDGGLSAVHDLRVDGVSPSWTGTRRLAAGPFPVERTIDLPLRGTGAWLVQATVDGARATSLVVRSPLSIDVTDGPAGRRVAVRDGTRPARAVEVRALTGGAVVASQTDIRGVAHVPSDTPVLAFDGLAVAFTPPETAVTRRPPARAPAPSADPLEERARKQRQKNAVQFDSVYQTEEAETLDASMF